MEELALVFFLHHSIGSAMVFRVWHKRAGVLGPIDTVFAPRLTSVTWWERGAAVLYFC